MDSRHALVSGSLAQVSPNPADGSTSDVGAMQREFGHRNESTPFASGASGQQDSNLNVFRGKAGNALGVPAVAGRHQRSYSVNETTQAARALSIVREVCWSCCWCIFFSRSAACFRGEYRLAVECVHALVVSGVTSLPCGIFFWTSFAVNFFFLLFALLLLLSLPCHVSCCRYYVVLYTAAPKKTQW